MGPFAAAGVQLGKRQVRTHTRPGIDTMRSAIPRRRGCVGAPEREHGVKGRERLRRGRDGACGAQPIAPRRAMAYRKATNGKTRNNAPQTSYIQWVPPPRGLTGSAKAGWP